MSYFLIIVLAPSGSEDLAVAALRIRVSDYIKCPCSGEVILASVQRCLTDRPPQKVATVETHSLAPDHLSPPCSACPQIIGESRTMREMKAYIARVAPTDSQVLITGETGTGKELVAASLHENSRRHKKPFVDINCAAIPDSLLESELFGYEKGAFTGANSAYEGKLRFAHGGTVFFDEIGDMSPYAQAKMLRALESREVQGLGAKKSIPVDVRVIAATNQNLDRMMEAGKFRKDLYFRLNVARIHLPSLSERKEDLAALAEHYITEYNRRFERTVEGFVPGALDTLLRYDWPGNVREVKNLIEAIFINLPPTRVTRIDLPEPFRQRLKGTKKLSPDERTQLLSVLFATNWNMSKAAQELHWSRMTVYRKMTKYHIVRGQKSEDGIPASISRKV